MVEVASERAALVSSYKESQEDVLSKVPLPQGLKDAYTAWVENPYVPALKAKLSGAFHEVMLDPMNDAFEQEAVNSACGMISAISKAMPEGDKAAFFKTIPVGLKNVYDRTSYHTRKKEQYAFND